VHLAGTCAVFRLKIKECVRDGGFSLTVKSPSYYQGAFSREMKRDFSFDQGMDSSTNVHAPP